MKPWLLLPMLLALGACASNPPTSPPPLPKPIVSCGEHAPFELLPAYPLAPASLDSVTADSSQSLYQLGIAKQYIDRQSAWAIQAAGVFQRDAIKRNATAQCLDALRARGVIL